MKSQTQSILEKNDLRNPRDRAMIEAIATELKSPVPMLIALAGIVVGIAGVTIAGITISREQAARNDIAETSNNLREAVTAFNSQVRSFNDTVARLETATNSAQDVSKLNSSIAKNMYETVSAGTDALRSAAAIKKQNEGTEKSDSPTVTLPK